MGISQTYINIIKSPAVDATINFIKKFKSSKSYWSVSCLINPISNIIIKGTRDELI